MEHPTKISKYRVLDVLGRGAMGIVYRAFDENIDRVVALKTVRADLLDGQHSGSVLARFRNEARAAGRLLHPGVVGVYDYGQEGGLTYIAMEYVEGCDLGDYFRRGVKFELSDTVSIMAQLLDALEHAHAQGVVHRDIKPSNLIVMPNGRIKVADFGIARIDLSELTQAGMVVGTPSYMSPEQFKGEAVDGRADLYASGVLLFQLLTGEKPFVGGSIGYKVCHEPAPAPSDFDGVTGRFDDVVARALQKDPAQRFQAAGEFRDALNAAWSAPVQKTVSTGLTGIIALSRAAEAAEPTASSATPATSTGSTSRGTAPTGWDPAVLRPIEQHLARFVGPFARVIIRNAASATTDLDELYDKVAGELESDADRRAFLATKPSAATQEGSGAGRTVTRTVVTQPEPEATGVPPEMIEKAARELAPFLGPIAKVVAKRAAPKASSRQDYYHLLAEQIEHPEQKRQFLKAAGLA